MKRLLTAALALVLGASAYVASTPGPAIAARPGAIFSCQATGQEEAVDPIVSPGVSPSAHLHVFFGAGPVSSTETSATLRTKATHCVETGNHSAFWTPAVYENGVKLRPGTTATGGGKHALLYYRCVTSPCSAVQTPPENMGLVEGNSHATTPAENPVFRNGLGGFRCGTGGGEFYPTPPTTCASGVLVLSSTFSPCVNDANVTAEPSAGKCPAGFIPIPRIQQYFRFWVGTGAVGTITLASGAPVTLHTDYLFGWDRATFENFLDRCIRVNVDCGTNPNV